MEGIGFCILGILCVLITLFIALLVIAILVAAGGVSGMVLSKGRGIPGKLSIGITLVGTITVLALLAGAWFAIRTVIRPKYSVNDEVVKPFLSTIGKVDRASLGFTPISPNSRIDIEYANGKHGYDVMLHIYAETSRTIAFKKKADGTYEWIGEQEIFEGPNQYETADGIFNEQIVINYDTVNLSGAPINQIFIIYSGDNQRLRGRLDLTLQDIRPILEEWGYIQNNSTK
jgi:hypothetical protein